MGKALVFAGLNVQNPLQILNFEEEDLDVTRITECFSGITSTQSAALKTLIRSLKLAGTFDKLSYLILPAIAGTVEESIRNVMVDSSSIPSTTYMSLTDNLLFVSNAVAVTAFVKPDTLNTKNLAMGAFVDWTGHAFPSDIYSEQVMKVNTGYIMYRDGTKFGYNDGTGASSGNRTKAYATTKYKIGMSTDIDNLTTKFIYAEDTVETFQMSSSASIAVTDTASVILSGPPYVDGGAKGYRTFTGGIKLLWVSPLLTEAELVATHKAFDEFITSVSGT